MLRVITGRKVRQMCRQGSHALCDHARNCRIPAQDLPNGQRTPGLDIKAVDTSASGEALSCTSENTVVEKKSVLKSAQFAAAAGMPAVTVSAQPSTLNMAAVRELI
jgi:hypothetical protein